MILDLSEVRVTYSGLIAVFMAILNVLLGFVFTIIIARALTPAEFGIWNLILGFIFYMVVIEPIVSYWVTRETARNISSQKTAVISSSFLSIGGIFGFLAIAFLVGNQVAIDHEIILLGSILVPVMILNNTLIGINLGWKPHTPQFARFFFLIAQICLLVLLVQFFQMGIEGIILSTFVSNIVSIIILTLYARKKLFSKFKLEYVKNWIRHSWLPLYPALGLGISSLGVIIFAVITQSTEGVGFWSAAVINVVLITQAVHIAKAAYPKLLHNKNSVYLTQNLNLLIFITILFTAITITFSKQSLFILNPVYETIFPVVIVIALWKFIDVIGIGFQSYITGIEEVDTKNTSSFKDYLKSKLFLVPTIALIQHSITMILLTIGLLSLVNSSQFDLLLYWAVVGLLVQIPITIYFYKLSKKLLNLSFEPTKILKYTFSGVISFGSVYLLMENTLNYQQDLIYFIFHILLYAVIAVGTYLVITYFLDSTIKELFHSSLNEIKKFKK